MTHKTSFTPSDYSTFDHFFLEKFVKNHKIVSLNNVENYLIEIRNFKKDIDKNNHAHCFISDILSVSVDKKDQKYLYYNL